MNGKRASLQSSFRERLNISQLAIKSPWLTVGFWIAVTVAGLLAFSSLKYALFPDITFPVVVVNATAPFETVVETETRLTEPIEKAIATLDGLVKFRSATYPGQTIVNLEFGVGKNLELATADVDRELEKINRDDGRKYQVIPLNLNESSAISYTIKSESKTLSELTEIARKEIIPEIAKIPGVYKVNLLGDETSKPPTLVRFNGKNSVAFQAIKRGSANTLEVVDSAINKVEKLQAELPDIQLVLAETQANYIREATQSTIDALLLAIALAVLVIFSFLRNVRATMIAALAIPISLLGTCIVMAAFGFNLETITLLGLALVIGIIVDDAIVDVENIYRHIEAGKNPRQAASDGTAEIGLTVTASTLTIVAVFLPIGFMGGTLGQFFKPFGITVSAAVLTSLLVARTLSPVLAVWWLKPRREREGARERGSDGIIVQRYRNLLHWSLNHHQIVIGLALVSLLAGIALIPLIPKGFVPQLDRGEFNIVYATPLPNLPKGFQVNDSASTASETANDSEFSWLTNLLQNPVKLLLSRSRSVAKELEAVVLAEADVESVFTIIGIRGEPNKGKLYVKLKGDRQLSTARVQENLRAALPELAGVTVSVEDIQFVDVGGDRPLKIGLVGEDIETLIHLAIDIKSRIDGLPGFVDVTATGDDKKEAEIGQILHLKGLRVAYVSANLADGKAVGDATEEVVAIARSLLPPSVAIDLEGDSGISSQVLGSFTGTLSLSVICMLLVLILPFGRLLEPLVVGLSLPLSIVGAMLALLITQSDFGMISLIGVIFLLGLLDKNALLLMDYTNQLRQQGMSRTEAIIKTGQVRLRPILMTTGSTILGMLPIALGLGVGAELRQPMAVVIIGGLLTSTLLSLIVVPVLYSLLEEVWAVFLSFRVR